MRKKTYEGKERRKFIRLDYIAPLGVKICKKKTVSKLLSGYTANISPAGLLCTVNQKVNKNDTLWVSFDRGTLSICEEMEKRVFIYQNGIVGKVVRIEPKRKGNYQVGIQFITREEKNLTHIYPKFHFVSLQKQQEQDQDDIEQEEDEDERI